MKGSMKVEPQPKGAWPKIKRFILFFIGLIVVINLIAVLLPVVLMALR